MSYFVQKSQMTGHNVGSQKKYTKLTSDPKGIENFWALLTFVYICE